MTRPFFPPVLTNLVNPILVKTGLREPYLPFQMLSLLRKLGITFFIALNQLTPLFQDPQEVQKTEEIGPKQFDRLDTLSKATEQEVSRLMALELTPFVGEKASLRDLRSSLGEWLVQNTIRSDPEVKAAMNQVLQRRREVQADVGPPVPPHVQS